MRCLFLVFFAECFGNKRISDQVVSYVITMINLIEIDQAFLQFGEHGRLVSSSSRYARDGYDAILLQKSRRSLAAGFQPNFVSTQKVCACFL